MFRNRFWCSENHVLFACIFNMVEVYNKSGNSINNSEFVKVGLVRIPFLYISFVCIQIQIIIEYINC